MRKKYLTENEKVLELLEKLPEEKQKYGLAIINRDIKSQEKLIALKFLSENELQEDNLKETKTDDDVDEVINETLQDLNTEYALYTLVDPHIINLGFAIMEGSHVLKNRKENKRHISEGEESLKGFIRNRRNK